MSRHGYIVFKPIESIGIPHKLQDPVDKSPLQGTVERCWLTKARGKRADGEGRAGLHWLQSIPLLSFLVLVSVYQSAS